MKSKGLLALSMALVLAAVGGCRWEPSRHVAPAETPVIPVAHPVVREVTDYVELTGRTEAKESVDIRPQVTGYLTRTVFKEGTEVKAGDLLFEIDPRLYKAQLDQAEAQVRLNQTSLDLAQTTYERDRHIASTTSGGVSQQQLAEDRAAVETARARLLSSEASRDQYRINFDYTKIISPIDGMVSRYYLTPGNLVTQNQTVLTTIVSQDPMYVYFDLDEPTMIDLRKAVIAGKLKRPRDKQIPVYMALQGEEVYSHEGAINFVNNQVSSGTGSITMRGEFPNKQSANDTRLLSPGMFVRVRLPKGDPEVKPLVIDRAIGTDQGLKYVYLLNADHTVRMQRVKTGVLKADGLRVITDGIKNDDWVVVGGLQQIRARMEVKPDEVAMPTLGRLPGTEAAPTGRQPADKKAAAREPALKANQGSR